MTKDELVLGAKQYMKEKGYKKRNTTWVKKDEDISVVVNIQSSQFDLGNFYINLGVYICSLGNKDFPSISDCHMLERINIAVTSVDSFIKIVDKWEQWYGTKSKIYENLLAGKKPMITVKQVYTYFLLTYKE